MSDRLDAAYRLHHYAVASHWHGARLQGPDPGVRFNYRIGRFIKSYLPVIRWADDLYYAQAQGYWILANWRLFVISGDETYRSIALRCSDSLLRSQRQDGGWDYPNPEWKGRIATAEGTWAALGFLESFKQTGEPAYLQGVLAWYDLLVTGIGFQHENGATAVNYFAHREGDRVPNNSAFVLRFLAQLAETTGNPAHAQQTDGLIRFLRAAQMDNGELPYALASTTGASRPHFQCFQYNAFQCLDVLAYYELTGDPISVPVIDGLVSFLTTGIGSDGQVFYDCDNRSRAVVYHAAAIAAALSATAEAGFARHDELAHRAYQYVLRNQHSDGGFPYSTGDYGVLRDRRSYPRYLAMILFHLLEGVGNVEKTGKEEAHVSVR